MKSGEVVYEFGKVVGAIRTSDGRIIVADAQAGQLIVFSATGEQIAAEGGKGAGPGASVCTCCGMATWTMEQNCT